MLGRVPGLARGLEVLEYLAQYPQGKTQKDIAAAMRLPAASASRITLRLEAAGYLWRYQVASIWIAGPAQNCPPKDIPAVGAKVPAAAQAVSRRLGFG